MEAVQPKVINVTEWISVAEYAKRSNISVRTTYYRIGLGVICHKEMHGITIIDVAATPPLHKLPRKAQQAPAFRWKQEIPPSTELITASAYCQQHKTRGHVLYRSLLLGEVEGWVIAEHLFIHRSLDPVLFKRKPAAKPRRRRF